MKEQPLVTFAILAYHHERFIREAVRGALSQTYSPLQVVVSDDCSQDGTFEAIREEVEGYDGPHEVVLNRNERQRAARVRELEERVEVRRHRNTCKICYSADAR